ncbi:MFS transporter [Granulicoccus sp. GXG6511]|uniref:MFS transporter n=1 Tax=Granulicoccus sp. GXG6511 TaxID=3381351 RepID=UPI003D7CBE13
MSIVTIVAALGTSLINVILPQVAVQFGAGMSTAQWATLAFLLSSTVLIVPAGWLGDTLGRARVLQGAIIVFLAGSLVAALAPSLGVIIAGRALQGVGVAAMLALPVALVRETVRPQEMGRAMGVIGSSMATGMALGPAVGGLIAASGLGWRGAFLLFLPLGLLALFLVGKKLPAKAVAPAQRRPLDLAGLLLLALALAGYSLAVTMTPGGWIGTTAIGVGVVVVLAFFVRRELRSVAPLVDLRMLNSLRIVPQLGMTFAGALVMMTFTVIPPFYLTLALGLDTWTMGLVMAVGPVMAILSGVPAGQLADRLGAARVTLVGLSAMTVASLAFVLLPPVWGVIGFLIAAVILTPGNQMFMAGNNTSVMSRADKAQQGAVSGVLNLARNLGFITGTALMSLVFDLAATRVTGVAGAALGMQSSFAIAALFGLAAVLVAFTAHRRSVIRAHGPVA